MQFLAVLVLELGGLAAEVLEQLADEGAGARRGIKDFDVLVDQLLPKCFSQSQSALSIMKRTISFGV